VTPIFDQLVEDMELFLCAGEHDQKVPNLFAHKGWFNMLFLWYVDD
jgi:hypothetical protein